PDGKIIGALHRSSSTTRVLAPGHPYTPPPAGAADARWRGRRRFAAPYSQNVAAHYAAELRAAEEKQLRESAAATLRRRIRNLERRERALLDDPARIDQAKQFRKLGDLLLAHAHTLRGRGATLATVPDDFTDGAPLTIPLDPAMDARENAARFYRQHKRLTA